MIHRRETTQGIEKEDVVRSLGTRRHCQQVGRQLVSPHLVVALLEIGDNEVMIVANRRHYHLMRGLFLPFKSTVYTVFTESGSA